MSPEPWEDEFIRAESREVISTAFEAWNLVVKLRFFMEKELPSENFEAFLSTAQTNSFELILEWLHCYLDRRTYEAINYDASGNSRDESLWPLLKESDIYLLYPLYRSPWKPPLRGFRLFTKKALLQELSASASYPFVSDSIPLLIDADGSSSRLPKTTYDRQLQRLFQIEFGLEEAVNEKKLSANRQVAAEEASCWRIAVSCSGSKVGIAVDRIVKDWLRPETSNSYNHWLPLDQSGRHSTASKRTSQDYQSRFGAHIEPCYWLSDNRHHSGLPFYLWDVKNKRTVETSSLQSTILYTAISHTWGRWKKSTPPVRVDGVENWLIPENEIFNVKNLPQILVDVPTKTPYVWFDLLCIPQDRSARALEEIARQATIFRKAQYAIAWLNTIEHWSGLKGAVEWMSLKYMLHTSLEYSAGQLDMDSEVRSTFESASTATGLFQPYEYRAGIHRSDMVPLGWFTSLWTLQEACLRPDLLLCKQDWEILSAGPQMPVPLDGLIALMRWIAHDLALFEILCDPDSTQSYQLDSAYYKITSARKLEALIHDGKYPRGFVELFELLERLSMLEDPGRETITRLGVQRHCSEGRAEAIMSVIGATNWWTEALRSGHNANANLVLGSYPLAFLREVVSIIGSQFYNSIVVRSASHTEILHKPNIRGSLLPFSPVYDQGSDEKFDGYSYAQVEDYPSVQTWTINSDGSVTIPEAAILTEPAVSPNYKLIGSICLAYVSDKETSYVKGPWKMDQDTRYQTVDLWEWKAKPFSSLPTHLVALNRVQKLGKEFVFGIVLEEIEQNVLVKIGVFNSAPYGPQASQQDIFPTRYPNWTVL
jgi:hypothetical protein